VRCWYGVRGGVGGMRCGYWVGWQKGVFTKVDGGVCKNDVNLEFSLLRVKIKFCGRVNVQNI
jgi:hypothetical protein